MKFKLLASIVVLAILGGFMYIWQVQSDSAKPGALFFPEDEKIVASGKIIYKSHCASCHGVNLEGQPNWKRPGPDGLMPAPPHNERGHTWHHTDDVLFQLTKYGAGKLLNKTNYKTNMPKYENILSDEEIIAVLSYIKSSWPKNIQEHHDRRNAVGAKVKQ